MPIVRYSNQQVAKSAGRVDHAKVDATTEVDIDRQRLEDEEEGEFDLKQARVIVAPEYVRGIRKKLRLTQFEFADRFQLSRRTVQEWEQGRAVPDQQSITLLRAIAHAPNIVEKALSKATISRSTLGLARAGRRKSSNAADAATKRTRQRR